MTRSLRCGMRLRGQSDAGRRRGIAIAMEKHNPTQSRMDLQFIDGSVGAIDFGWVNGSCRRLPKSACNSCRSLLSSLATRAPAAMSSEALALS